MTGTTASRLPNPMHSLAVRVALVLLVSTGASACVGTVSSSEVEALELRLDQLEADNGGSESLQVHGNLILELGGRISDLEADIRSLEDELYYGSSDSDFEDELEDLQSSLSSAQRTLVDACGYLDELERQIDLITFATRVC